VRRRHRPAALFHFGRGALVLRVDKATVYFAARDGRAVHTLDRVSLDIPDGGFVVALGTSGCGKSTLLNAMAGFLPLSSGSITLNGRAVEGPGKERGVVFQKDTLLPWKTVAENVVLGLKFAGVGRTERRERALDLLSLVGLQDFAAAAPYELSGGMRQRVGIARALAPEPDILLMDEPFGALDSMTREAMQELLVDVWARTRKQIFFITHSIEEALFLGTHLVVMSPRPGRIVARFDLSFVHAFARDRDARAIKTAPEFAALREEIRAIVHQNEAVRTAAQ
jgi:taurine transport system ATP-binding protein